MATNQVIELFNLVAPERSREVDRLWQLYRPIFNEAADKPEFVMQAGPYGLILYNNRTILRSWLLTFAMWQEMYCWSSFLHLLNGRAFELQEFNELPGQQNAYEAADRLYTQSNNFSCAPTLDWSQWPASVPKPGAAIATEGREQQLVNDLVHHVVAFFLLHELRHCIVRHDSIRFADGIAEELDCDRWASRFLLEQSANYATTTPWDPQLVRSKRAMGLVMGVSVIANVQMNELSRSTADHPSAVARMKQVADTADMPVKDYFWNVACCCVLASMRRFARLPSHADCHNLRDLFYNLLACA